MHRHSSLKQDRKPDQVVLVLSIMLVLLLSGCDITGSTDEGENPDVDDRLVSEGWLIPKDEIMDGGPGKDGIPSIDEPVFKQDPDELPYLEDERYVAVVKIEDEIREYPHQILDYHEIVNDEIGDEAVAMTHCPLTGTAIAWNREIDGQITEFGVSGLIFRNNLIAFDRASDSYWPQMQNRAAQGVHRGHNIETYQVLETTWATVQQVYPEARVLSSESGFTRNYGGYAYGPEYPTEDDRILFPITHEDDRLPNKQRVHGIIRNETAREDASVGVYVIEDLDRGIEIIEDQVAGKNYLIVGSSGHDFVAAFEYELEDGTRPDFQPVDGELPVVMEDGEGNRWNWFGYAVEGPREGQRLTPAQAYTGYFFAWADFFPYLDIRNRDV